MSSKQCIIYARYSPRPKGETDPESNDMQIAHCEQRAFNEGWEVAGIFQDKMKSGSDESRPGLWKAVSELKKGDVLLVYKWDRLARNVYLMEILKRAVKVKNCRIVAVTGDVMGDTPESIMVRQMLAAVSEYERKVTGLRTAAALRYQQAKGKRVGRYPPYGFAFSEPDENEKITLIEVPEEQEALEIIKGLHDDGLSPGEIAVTMRRLMPDRARKPTWRGNLITRIVNRYEAEKAMNLRENDVAA